jgi:hypothetical protein
MDALLKLLADASLDVTAAEEALDAAAFHTAVERLDEAAVRLDALRAAWPTMSGPERAVVGPSAASVRTRLDAGRTRIPKLSALSVGTAVNDPDQDSEPPD